LEKYAKDVVIEANTLKNMVFQGVLPSVFVYSKELTDSLIGMKNLGFDVSKSAEKQLLEELTTHSAALKALAEKLEPLMERIDSLDPVKQAEVANVELTALIDAIRVKVDSLEAKTGQSYWLYPKYTELLF
jgi:glutamine synthetase